MRKGLFLLGIIAFTAGLPQGLQAASTPHWVHYRLLADKPPLPKKVVLLPVAVEVVEVTAGGVKEEVPDWSKEASDAVFKALTAAIQKQSGMQQVATPKFSGDFASHLDEHVALYKLVVNTASKIGWDHKIKRFDYGIGPGLGSLAKYTGADAAIMVYGRDYVSTGGRKARAVLGNIPIINWFSGPPPQLGHSFIHIGMVDLKTGDLLWMNSKYREGSTNLRDPEDSASMVQEIFEWYPGIEKYRSAYVK